MMSNIEKGNLKNYEKVGMLSIFVKTKSYEKTSMQFVTCKSEKRT